MFDLMQTIDKPTHRCGHILDWILHRRDDEIKCVDLTPSDYTINSFARNSKGGGIAVLAKNSVAHRITYTSKFTFNHVSFELVHATLVLHNQTINFFCIYRPPSSRKNKLSFTLFLEEEPVGFQQFNHW